MRKHSLVRWLLAAALWLIWLQAGRVLFSVLFGIIYDTLFAERVPLSFTALALILLVLATLTPAWRGLWPLNERIGLLLAPGLAFLARIPLTVDSAPLRLWAGLIALAAAGRALGWLLRGSSRLTLGALVAALVADQVLRAAGATWDLSLQSGWLPVQVVWSLAGIGLTVWIWLQPRQERAEVDGISWQGALALGGLLFLETNLLGLPNGLARWAAADYAVLAPLLVLVTGLPLLGWGLWPRPLLERRVRLGLGLVLLAGLLTGARVAGWAGAIGLLLAQLAALLLLPLAVGRRTAGQGLALAGGLLLFLLLNFLLAFAFTYPYTLPVLRGSGLAIHLAAALFMGLLVVGRPTEVVAAGRERRWRSISAAALLVVVLVVGWSALPRPAQPLAAERPLRIAQYNIHYGYDTDWHLSLARQAETIAASGADVVSLQEVDTGRITSYSIDDAYWLGRRLGMVPVYLPTVEKLTGVVLLVRPPLLATSFELLPSAEEQTGIVHARLRWGEQPVDAFGAWLGLSEAERAQQIKAALEFIQRTAPSGPATFGGDFNSEPGSPVYQAIAAAGFSDPFRALGLGDVPTDPAVEPAQRIDFIWLRGLRPTAAGVPESLASDHRLVWVEAEP